MGRRKKSGTGGGALGALVIGIIVVIAAIPKEAWIAIGVLTALGLIVYFASKSSNSTAPTIAQKEDEDSPGISVSARNFNKKLILSANGAQEPVSVSTAGSASESSTGFRIPTAPKGHAAAKWISPNESIEVSGLVLRGGLFYVGSSLPCSLGCNDPCLIDPSKPVARSGSFAERQTNYWPSYSEITPSARRAYLNWLAEGRSHPEADLGYVFLFFYGLERRAVIEAVHDPIARQDWPLISAEVRRLLKIYGQNTSFKRYASGLLDWIELAGHPANLYEQALPSFPKTFELPMYIRLALGQAVLAKVPIPPHLALAWARLDPNIRLKTAANRCIEEFNQLFVRQYREAFGEGLVISPNRTKLKFIYRPASAGFRGYGEIKLAFGEILDVSVLTGPLKKLQPIIDKCTQELESYSRYVGRNPDRSNSLEALLQLPATLWPESAQKVLNEMKARMADGMIVISYQELLSKLEARSVLTKEKTLGLARALESMNIGMEPDVLGGAKIPKADEKIVLFAVPASEVVSRQSASYQAALLTLQLSSAMARADGEFSPAEINHLRMEVQAWSHLTPNHQRRLLAHLRLLVAVPVSLTTLKKKLEPLALSAREAIAAFMATVAQSDGAVSPDEVKMLEKIYKVLGVEPKKVFSDIHAAAVGVPATGQKESGVTGFKLDPQRVAELQKDTERVTALLANIFQEEPVEVAVVADTADVDEFDDPEPVEVLLGLDEAHSGFARVLLSRAQWSRQELLDVSADMDLMLDGALERVNEASFDIHDMPLTEGDDPVDINPEALERIEA